MRRHLAKCGRLLSVALTIGTTAGCGGEAAPGAASVPMDEASVWATQAAYVGESYGNPAVASFRAGSLDAFYLHDNGTLRHRYFDYGMGNWSEEGDLGSPSTANRLASDPAAVSWGDGRIDVFFRDMNNQLGHRWWTQAGGWSGWELNMGAMDTGRPAVASQANGSLDVFVRSTSHQLMTRSFRRGSGWSAWSTIGGSLVTDPAAVSWGPGRLDVFARSASDHLQHWWWVQDAGWSGPEDLGGDVRGPPAAASWGVNRLDVFARNRESNLVHLSWNGRAWAWETLPAAGGLDGGPAAVSWGPNRVDVLLNRAAGIRQYTWIDTLAVPLFAQEQSNWCWAASTEMIAQSFGVAMSQCDEANQRFHRTDCCAFPSNCNTGGWPEFPRYGMTAAVKEGALTLDQVKEQVVTKGKPFAFSWLWAGGKTSHMMVATDYLRFADQDWVAVNNPLPVGVGSRSLITYARFVSDTDHSHYWDYYDVRVTKDAGDTMVSLSLGNRFQAPSRFSDSFCNPGEQCELGDVNGDGMQDVVAFDHAGGVRVAIATGTSFEPSITRWHLSFCYGAEQCRVADVNGDRKADLLVFTGSGPVYVSLSSGLSFGGNQQWHSGFCWTGETCDVGDFNGDKRSDLVVLKPGGTAIVSLSNGASFGGNAGWTTSFDHCFDGQQCKVGDVTGDGKADLLGFTLGTTSNVFVAPSTGNSFGAATQWSDYFGVAGEVLGIGDLDGDAVGDVVTVARNNGNAFAALSTKSSFTGVGQLWGVEIGMTADEVRFGDVNGDGRADIVTFFR